MKPIRVLFVCHGNICRSTMAQYVFQYMVDNQGRSLEFYIDSAATSYEEIGNGVHRGTRAKLAQVGIPCGDHKARRMTKEDYEEFDYVIGMDRENDYNIRRIVGGDPDNKIYSLLSFAGLTRDIADPWYTGNFDATYSDVCLGLTAFLEQI